jgi:mono/diheme cytochrome c family protein
VTEIPEHLLKRSKAAKAKASGDAAAGDDAAAAPAGTSPAVAPKPVVAAAPKAAVEPAGPTPPPPDTPVVAAYKRRRKIPVWAMMTLSILPLWAFMYVRALTPQAKEVAGPLGSGAKTYAVCASCHGGAGEGGVGYQFSQGEVLKTFPHIEDQLRFVYAGSAAYKAAGVQIYGNPDRPGGPHQTEARGVMPQQGAKYGGGLTEAEILGVVCHERYTISGADPAGAYQAEYEKWCSPESPIYAGLESGSLTFDNLAANETGILEVGTTPLAGSPPK